MNFSGGFSAPHRKHHARLCPESVAVGDELGKLHTFSFLPVDLTVWSIDGNSPRERYTKGLTSWRTGPSHLTGVQITKCYTTVTWQGSVSIDTVVVAIVLYVPLHFVTREIRL